MIVAQLQVWLGGSVGHHRVAAALVAPAVTASVAVRRRYPTLVGIGVPVLTAFELALWGDPQIVANAVAYFCALYALAIWTPPRRFASGAALIVAADLAASAGPKQNLHNTLPFAVVTPVVMLPVRRVLGDRERP